MELSDYYVYVLFRPDGVPCYVGKGRGRRWMHDNKRKHNRHLENIIARADRPLNRIRSQPNLTDSEALELEEFVISQIGRKAHGGPLVNQTNGGDGSSGYRQTEEQRQNNKKAQLRPEVRSKKGIGIKAVWQTPGFREAMSDKRKKENLSKETIAKMSESAKLRMANGISKEHSAKLSKIHKGNKHWKLASYSHERKEKYRQAMLGNTNGLGYKHTAEARAKMSAAAKGRKQSPEHIAKRVAAAWKTRKANAMTKAAA